MIKLRHFVTALALAAMVLTTAPVAAADGVMNGVAFSGIPRGASFEVRSFDDSDANLLLEKDFAAAVTAAGYTTAANAKLILNFETRDEIGAWSTEDGRHILSFQSRVGQKDGEDARAEVNVYNSASGGLLNRGSGGGTSITTPSSYRIDVSIEDRETGKTLWQGWAVAELRGADGLDLTRRMVPKLVGVIGKTVRQEPFTLY